jgi:hypothetical protein
MMRIKTIIVAFFCLTGAQSGYGESVQGAVVTRIEGRAEIFIKKTGQTQPANTKSVQLNSQVYYAREAKKGDRPANGDVIVSDSNSKVRLIFRNGDQITVAPSSAYQFSWDVANDRNPISELLYGDIRAVIHPLGPRAGLKVNTKDVAMGVRGTDFFASSWSGSGGTKVTVLRGKVAMISRDQDQLLSKAPEIPAGASGTLKPKTKSPATDSSNNSGLKSAEQNGNAKNIEDVLGVSIQPATKQELVVIQKDSVVKNTPTASPEQNSELNGELALLEKKAFESTLSELKDQDPALYKALSTGNSQNFDSDTVQAAAVKKIFVEAPSDATDVKKPTLKDLESGGDVYERYKWNKSR